MIFLSTMNASMSDPLQGDLPEVIDEYLEYRTMKCVAFNRRGTLLAAGCTNGSCIIWDFETRRVVKELNDKDCTSPITSVSWSKYGHRILVSSSDKSLTLWDVLKGQKLTRISLQQSALQAHLHPGSSIPTTCLACPVSLAPMIVNLIDGTSTFLPISEIGAVVESSSSSGNKFLDGSVPYSPIAACFNKYGDLVYLGNSQGEILIVDYFTAKIRAVVKNGSIIRSIVFSRNGSYVVTNSNDRTMRIYENLLPVKDGGKAMDGFRISDVKAVGKKSLLLLRELQESVGRIQWKVPCFSGDGKWVIAGSSNKGEHKIYIWDRAAGRVVKTLEGPKEALLDVVWHPVRPVVVSVSFKGLVYTWTKDYTENWSGFASGFEDIDETEEYVEREDEFDLIPDLDPEKERVDEDEEIDVLTMDKDPIFSDSDGQDELCFLPMGPIPEQQDKFVDCSSKLSPITEETKARASNNVAIWLEDNSEVKNWNGNYETKLRKKRKLSDMITEFWLEKGKKTSSISNRSGERR